MKKSNYKKDLKKICKFITHDEDIDLIKKYSQDWRKRFSNYSYGVIFPQNIKQVSMIVKYANKNNIKLIPQGGNTGLVGGTSPFQKKKEIIINFEKMNKVLNIDVENKFVELEAGVIVDDINAKLQKHNFIFPLKISSSGSSQIGGIISTNAGGINVVRYGSIRKNLLSLEIVLASGEIAKLGSNLIKDNTGYNLKDLFCGSEGTLGLITKASIRIFSQPKDYLDIFISFKDLNQTLEMYNFISKNFEDNLESIELISNFSFDLCLKHGLLKKSFFERSGKYYLLVRFISFEKKDYLIDKFQNILIDNNEKFIEFLVAQNEKQSFDFWDFREKLTEAQKIDGKLMGFDISVPNNKIPFFLENAEKDLKKIIENIKFHIFGHLGDSNLHFNLIAPDKFKNNFYDYEKKIKKIINKYLIICDGSVSAEHGIGLLKKEDFYETKSKLEIKLMKKIKKLLDPKSIFNNKKIFN